ncbi:ABC transporter ATP-binding protein [Thiolapillus brandeum]|uniref:ABC transporter ATP-binding protein n=1 Tax=Thiolapillus brandeum TaxID=1076588 RepID=A0A7U6JIK4_9GAMM|nr:ABC transporter ATP-binding protein [Thiolapillus brandeum]BAO44903.1 ABC transporter ATP-binding protein [Thiolapillus brandeum]
MSVPDSSRAPAIQVKNLSKTYGSGSSAVTALRNINMSVQAGEVVGLLGPSGSGKTTLLQCLGAILDPSGGHIALAGETLYDDGWKYQDRRALRRDHIGFIFQRPYLIPFMNATENIAFLPMLQGKSNKVAYQRARDLLNLLEIAHRADARIEQLSGGEQQRVSIARALANHPPVILADEPTAPLDSHRALIVMKLLHEMAQKAQTAIVVVTHDENIIPLFRRLYRLRDGVLHEEQGEGRAL